MLDYTANDVLHLPILYSKFKFDLEEGEINLTFEEVLMECKKYLGYSKINMNIKNYNKICICEGKEIEGMLK